MRTRTRFGLVAALVAATAWTAPDAPVADAAMEGDRAAVEVLIAEGADVNAARGDGMTALHWAARHGDASLAGMLLEAGAEVERTTRIGDHRPLHVAATVGATEVVRLLLDAGAEADPGSSLGGTPLMLAAGAGDAASVRLLLGEGADPNAVESRWGQTPLMFAAAGGRTDAVRALLEGGADPAITGRVIDVSERNRADGRAQRLRRERLAAEREGRLEAWERERAAAGEALAEARSAPETFEEIEARGGEPEPLGYADLVGTYGGLAALHLAAREGRVQTVFALVEEGVDIDQRSAADGTTPLLIATLNGYFDLAMALIERGADVTLASDAGATPLYAAINMQWAPKSRHPQPTVHLQQRTGYMELMTALLDAGADPDVRLEKSLWYTTYNRDLLGVDRTGATPFWRAAYALDVEAMKLLVARGADPHLATIKVPERRRSRGETEDPSGLAPVPLGGPAVYPVHAASGVGHGQGYAGNSHRHVPGGWLPAVRYLVEELGADPTAPDHNGYNAIHHAAARGDNELILYLVEKGVDPTAVARSGQTTIDMANGPVQRVQPYPETIELLEGLGAVNNHNCVSC